VEEPVLVPSHGSKETGSGSSTNNPLEGIKKYDQSDTVTRSLVVGFKFSEQKRLRFSPAATYSAEARRIAAKYHTVSIHASRKPNKVMATQFYKFVSSLGLDTSIRGYAAIAEP
jgi:hypothetical protein